LKIPPPATDPNQAVQNVIRWIQKGKVDSPLPTATTDKIRKALDTPVKVDFNQIPPKEILDYLQDKVKGFNLVISASIQDPGINYFAPGPAQVLPATLKLQESVPVGAIFQFLEDQYHWRFVIREYGIVVTEQHRVPPRPTHIQDFWKNRAAPTTVEK